MSQGVFTMCYQVGLRSGINNEHFIKLFLIAIDDVSITCRSYVSTFSGTVLIMPSAICLLSVSLLFFFLWHYVSRLLQKECQFGNRVTSTCLVSTHLFPQLWCDGKRNCDTSAGLWHRGLGSGKWLVRVLPAVSSSCPGLSTTPPPNYSVPNGATRYCIKMLVSLFTYLLEPPASFLLCFLLIRSPEFLQAGSS